MSKQQINVYRDLMGENEKWAEDTRKVLDANGLTMLNLIGSPGCGKTTILEKMVGVLGDRFQFAVLEGDVETTNDAERLNALGIPVSQLITSGACHLSAKMVNTALKDLPLDELDIVFVENVGNLVCPAQFDIGETAKIAVLSITEGEDKPLKYPMLFREAKAAILSKTDLLQHLPFDLDACRNYFRQINGNIPLFEVSATSGNGMAAWIDWVAGIA